MFLHRKGWFLRLPHLSPSQLDAHSRAGWHSTFRPAPRDGGEPGDPLGQKSPRMAVAPAARPALPYGSGTISWTKASPETRPATQQRRESARRCPMPPEMRVVPSPRPSGDEICTLLPITSSCHLLPSLYSAPRPPNRSRPRLGARLGTPWPSHHCALQHRGGQECAAPSWLSQLEHGDQ